ncbi:MAG: iron-only hydrogenase system regulator [Erysipelotrichaceae bacterium]|jgi:putative iron-only hydrogenase system regulator|uniref:TM1266 family iron-only hydrogenase system putative regulator n=1 Tax=Lactimicrobium massiliense TaxID=2161814 RepID=UPI000D561536|nr:TM1266 family iron-only hydrogenase system putative regulator [Lactimicrobium massiliense]MCH4019744.1 iron-only hydrogenase system regulator [Erysipelotrichaceae bacterium]MCI1327028.1 iron-only hydrogenase system regulator [Solobacterium sp.]MCH4045263.1 iron-only hydrogenase system regulator [Erysipelotrichaceae bacterium]MCH4122473.1 iron-only hydrogenase system regulator [Erysipelotrichaceae bacterium]MCI1363754.1 iron-only hydrogenase system regulator [Solobacterium sp.]
MEESRIAMLAIVVEDTNQVSSLNEILHEYSQYIIGRMGLPYPKRNISLISIAMDAPGDVISALCGRLGNLSGITVKAAYSRL